MLSTKASNAQNTEELGELEDYIVPESFVSSKEFLVKGQRLACDLGIALEAKSDTQAAFLGVLQGFPSLFCVQVICPPTSQEDLKRKPWIPICAVVVDKRIVRGAFITNFDGLKRLAQGALERDKNKQLVTYYATLLARHRLPDPISTSELNHRINARLVAADQERLTVLLNPEDLEQAAQTACQRHNGEDQLLQRFTLMNFTYHRLWPDDTGCPPDARSIAAEETGRLLYQDLRVKLAVPSALLDQSMPVSLKPMLRFPGDGGSTGRGLGCTWLYPADLQQAEQLGNAFVCDIELPLLPESNGTVITECLQQSMSWLVDSLQTKFKSVNRAWSIDWDSVSLFGASFGGGMAMLAWMTASRFRVQELVLRAPLLRDYRRDPGDYAGIPISHERASGDSLKVLTILARMPYVLPRSGSEPPEGMYTGPMFSIAHRFLEIWKAKTVKDWLLSKSKCPDGATRVFIRHGSEDKHVPVQDTVDAVEWMKGNWHIDIDFEVQTGKAHVWDAWEPLSLEQKAFFGMSG